MIDPTTIARLVATTALAFGVSGSTRTTTPLIDSTTARPVLRHDFVDTHAIPVLPRARPGNLWL